MAKHYNSRVRHRGFKVGDLVLRKVTGVTRDPSLGKLDPNWEGPYRITSWELLVTKFLSKFFPVAKTNAMRREIADFYQDEQEKFYESWERFKDLILKCPHHGFETWRLLQYFYNGLTQTNRNIIEFMNGGGFFESCR